MKIYLGIDIDSSHYPHTAPEGESMLSFVSLKLSDLNAKANFPIKDGKHS